MPETSVFPGILEENLNKFSFFHVGKKPNFSLKLTKPLIYSMINADIKIVGTLLSNQRLHAQRAVLC